ncbi:Homeodomain-like superfamily protein [Rhynchospora pubera]|uniref:Homeodomain-like superfamily protein n=1 Tax=Rhynchospora pubera TaxID=906938 RepID=A0AAV8BVA6_9POAL|nr:Homeodomain-like superfamily protein [Rhynchospora pubera]
MELFPAQPDLSLQISTPNNTQETMKLGFWRRSIDPNSNLRSDAGTSSNFNLLSTNHNNSLNPNSSSIPNYHPHFLLHSQPLLNEIHNTNHLDLSMLKPIRGIPVYHTSPHSPHFPSFFHNTNHNSIAESSVIAAACNLQRSPRFLARVPAKRSARAPRMRWTTSLHARFVHAVELLGGHERATPKSVLELMDVKDLTLAHVKSHLQQKQANKSKDGCFFIAYSQYIYIQTHGNTRTQMYRTIKTTDHRPATPGQTKTMENSDDSLPDINNCGSESSVHLAGKEATNLINGLWSNSSSIGSWLQEKPRDFTSRSFNSLEELRSQNFEEMTNPNSASFCTKGKRKPNLEFTLGR